MCLLLRVLLVLPAWCLPRALAQTPAQPPEQLMGCRWNLFIKTDGYLDSFLNVGADLSVGSAQVVACPANGYVQGLNAVTTCAGFESLQVCTLEGTRFVWTCF